MINITCIVMNYDNPAKQDIKIHNHWNQSEMVVLEINGEKYTVLAKDIQVAVANCTNTNRWS